MKHLLTNSLFMPNAPNFGMAHCASVLSRCNRWATYKQ